VGPLELSGKGWAQAVADLLKTQIAVVIMAVRPHVVEDVQKRWNIPSTIVWHSETIAVSSALEVLRHAVSNHATADHPRSGTDEERHPAGREEG
jgi:hypothetical protein